jgi:hypothetical protein
LDIGLGGTPPTQSQTTLPGYKHFTTAKDDKACTTATNTAIMSVPELLSVFRVKEQIEYPHSCS